MPPPPSPLPGSGPRAAPQARAPDRRNRKWITEAAAEEKKPAIIRIVPRRTENCFVWQAAAPPQPQSIVSTGVIGSIAPIPARNKTEPTKKRILTSMEPNIERFSCFARPNRKPRRLGPEDPGMGVHPESGPAGIPGALPALPPGFSSTGSSRRGGGGSAKPEKGSNPPFHDRGLDFPFLCSYAQNMRLQPEYGWKAGKPESIDMTARIASIEEKGPEPTVGQRFRRVPFHYGTARGRPVRRRTVNGDEAPSE